MTAFAQPPTVMDHHREADDPVVDVTGHTDVTTRYQARRQKEGQNDDTITHRHVKKHHGERFESENNNKKRIQALENEKLELLKLNEQVNEENKALKGNILYGPNVVKLKQIEKEKRLLKKEVFKLSEDKRILTEQLKDAKNSSNEVRDRIYDKNWDGALERAKQRNQIKEKSTKIPDNGNETKVEPTNGNSQNVGIKIPNTVRETIDNIEKEVESLWRNVWRFKYEKDMIDTMLKQNGTIQREPTIILNVLEERIEKEVERFKESLDGMIKKHTKFRKDIGKLKREAINVEKRGGKNDTVCVNQNKDEANAVRTIYTQTDITDTGADEAGTGTKKKLQKSKMTQTLYDDHKSTKLNTQPRNALERRKEYDKASLLPSSKRGNSPGGVVKSKPVPTDSNVSPPHSRTLKNKEPKRVDMHSDGKLSTKKTNDYGKRSTAKTAHNIIPVPKCTHAGDEASAPVSETTARHRSYKVDKRFPSHTNGIKKIVTRNDDSPINTTHRSVRKVPEQTGSLVKVTSKHATESSNPMEETTQTRTANKGSKTTSIHGQHWKQETKTESSGYIEKKHITEQESENTIRKLNKRNQGRGESYELSEFRDKIMDDMRPQDTYKHREYLSKDWKSISQSLDKINAVEDTTSEQVPKTNRPHVNQSKKHTTKIRSLPSKISSPEVVYAPENAIPKGFTYVNDGTEKKIWKVAHNSPT
ncbi:uncharacterized protein LOC128228621 [Mya arenaria]|uniref:uncharacterized protein LOC128228621 n=1 Tax=Mya arenaria TaxID=6604 RepID=UPI0022E37A36|nr:uncharacterized protein LOC128228621 [Mya arenaria]